MTTMSRTIPPSRRCSSTSGTSRGFDFTGYKRASLARRFDEADDAVGIDDVRRLPATTSRSTRTSSPQLFNTILINVTGSSATRGVGRRRAT